jgi:acetate---CoA ligase (ADP-forming)
VIDARVALDAFDELARTLAHHGGGDVVVQEMAGDGVELILGVRNAPEFGSFVIVGPGGTLVEIADRASVRRGPIDADEARAMLAETAAAKLLAGVRGKGPWDAEAAVSAIAALSRFGAMHLATLATIEINPLIVGRNGALGVDMLAEPHLA